MSLENLKIKEYASGISELPDYPSDAGYTAAELKALFDARSDNEIKEKHNALVDEVAGNAERMQTTEENISTLEEKMESAEKNISDLTEEARAFVKRSEITDSLESTDKEKPLSANMGRVLKEYADATSGVPKLAEIAYAPSVTLAVNTMSVIAELTGAISISLAPGVEGYDNEWSFTVTQGATAYDIVLPSIMWGLSIAPTFAARTTTVCRLYYVGEKLCGEWVSV